MKTKEYNCYLWGYDKTLYFKKETDSGSEEVVLERGKTLTAFYGGAQTGKLLNLKESQRGIYNNQMGLII